MIDQRLRPLVVGEDASVREVLTVIGRQAGCALVVDQAERLVGMITDRDLSGPGARPKRDVSALHHPCRRRAVFGTSRQPSACAPLLRTEQRRAPKAISHISTRTMAHTGHPETCISL